MGKISRQVLQATANPGNLVGDAISLWQGYSEYKQNRRSGEGKVMALTKAAGSMLYSEAYMAGISQTVKNMGITGGFTNILANVGISMGAAAVTGGASMLGFAWENTGKKMAQAYASKGRFGSGYFDMSEAGYTMRQRSLNAIRSNGLNTQSALGNEARTYYRSSL